MSLYSNYIVTSGGTRNVYEYTATTGQSVFACTYTSGTLDKVDLWLNGWKLKRNTDYIETVGSEGASITLVQAAVLNDDIEIIVWE